MGISSKTRLGHGGFTLVELLVTMAISSLIATVVVMLFQAGLFHIRRSSGRIDLVRRARNCMDNTQRYLSAAVRPDEASASQAFCDPDPLTVDDMDFSDDAEDHPFSFVRYWTASDFIGGTPTASARELQTSSDPAYYVYELAEVQGEDGVGNDVVLRRYTDPVTQDMTETPRVIARYLGVFDEASGDYRDGFVVRLLSPSALQLQVAATGSRIHGELEAHSVANSANMTIRLTTIIQLPFYSNI